MDNLSSTAESAELEESNTGNDGENIKTIVQATILALIAIGVLVLNFMITFTCYKKSHLLTISNRFICNLTVSNLIFGISVLPFMFTSSIARHWMFGVLLCNLTGFLTTCFTTVSMLTIAVIAMDRYYAIVKPMIYPLKMTMARCIQLHIWIWVQSVGFTLPPLFGWSGYRYHEPKAGCLLSWDHHLSYTVFYLATCVLLPYAVLVFCYARIFQIARSKARRVSIGGRAEADPPQPPAPPLSRRMSLRQLAGFGFRRSSPGKALRTVSIVIGTHSVAWCPLMLVACCEALRGPDYVPAWLQTAATWLALSSFAVTPVVYGFWNKTIRRELLQLCCQSYVLNEEQEFVLMARRDSAGRTFSISDTITDLTPVQVAMLRFKAMVSNGESGTSSQSVESAGTVLTCIDETDDEGGSRERPALPVPKRFSRRDRRTSIDRKLSLDRRLNSLRRSSFPDSSNSRSTPLPNSVL